MLRLATPDYLRFSQADRFSATFGGGEANVAVSLANFGLDSTYVTKLPKHAIGQAAAFARSGLIEKIVENIDLMRIEQ